MEVSMLVVYIRSFCVKCITVKALSFNNLTLHHKQYQKNVKLVELQRFYIWAYFIKT